MDAVGHGLLEGATNLGIGFVGEKAGLDPLAQALSSRAIVGFLDGAFNPNKTVGASIFNAFSKSAFDLATLGGDKANDPVARATYLAKINDFSNIVREQGLTTALENYATSIFQREAVEDIYRLGGIADVLLGNVDYNVKIAGVDVKKVTINPKMAIYLDPITDDFRGRQFGSDYIEYGTYGVSPDGQFKLKEGFVQTRTGDFWMLLRIQDGIPLGYTLNTLAPSSDILVQPTVIVTPEAFNDDGTLRSGVIENKVTGLKLLLKDNWLTAISVSTAPGEVDTVAFLTQVGVSRLRPEELATAINAFISNGICNGSCGAPPYLEGWRQEFVRAGANSNSIFLDPTYENGNAGRDLFLWLTDTLGADPVTNDLITKADARFLSDGGLPAGHDRMVVAYSGSGNPWIKVLHRKDYGVSTYMGIGTPEVQKDFKGTSVKRAISIVGEDDWVGRLFRGGDLFTGVEHQYRIVLKGVDHVHYSYDPANPTEIGLKSAKFIALMGRNYNNDAWIGNELRKYKQTDGRYLVDLDQFAIDHGF